MWSYLLLGCLLTAVLSSFPPSECKFDGRNNHDWLVDRAQQISVERMNDFSLALRAIQNFVSLLIYGPLTVQFKPQLIQTDGQFYFETQLAIWTTEFCDCPRALPIQCEQGSVHETRNPASQKAIGCNLGKRRIKRETGTCLVNIWQVVVDL